MASRTPTREPKRMVRPPAHPVAQLQGPFEESMVESIHEADLEVPADSVARRTLLLDAPTYERVIAGRWKQKAGEKYHPLWKLIAQLSFGIHLLAQGMAKSEDEVMRILQVHVDDIDGFLERSTEDFDIAQTDVQERLRCLKLPLAHPEVFDRMLEDRAFRASILDGNQKIEHIVSRTARAMRDSLKDVQKGFDATNTLEKYLVNLETTWSRPKPEHEAVYVAMLGNVEGWRRAFLELHLQGNKLAGALKKLTELVQEMEQRAAEVSRRTIKSMQFQGHPQGPLRGSVAATIVKPLPQAPETRYSIRPMKSGRVPTVNIPDSESARSSGDLQRSGQSLRDKSSTASRASGGSTNTAASAQLATSADKSTHVSRVGQVSAIPPRIIHQHTRGVSQPVELPADVPEEALLQAPVSRNSRFSMLLSPKSRDHLQEGTRGDRTSKALTDQIKITSSPDLARTPETTFSQEISPPTPRPDACEAKMDYFVGVSKTRSQTVSPLPNVEDSSLKQETPTVVPPLHMLSRPASAGKGLREHPAFSFHPPELPMATPAQEPLPKSIAKLSRLAHSRTHSHNSSIGEPGPSLHNVDMHSAKGSIDTSTVLSTGDSMPAIRLDEPLPQHQFQESVAIHGSDVPTRQNASFAKGFVAELEAASVPRAHSGIMIELEAAPQHHFRLPPRSSATTKPVSNAHELSMHELEATPSHHFRLPPRSSAKPNSAEGGQTESTAGFEYLTVAPVPEQNARISPLAIVNPSSRLHESKPYVPNDIAGPPPRIDSKRSSLRNPHLPTQVAANVINEMSRTPSQSPIHERTPSCASTHSAQIIMSSTNQSKFAPPTQALPPPGPGGRSMAVRDFANAGEFEGERSRPQRGSHGSKSSWKEFFVGSINVPRAQVTSLPANSSGHGRRESQQRTSDMITSAGKDVLWFKGNQRASAGMTTA